MSTKKKDKVSIRIIDLQLKKSYINTPEESINFDDLSKIQYEVKGGLGINELEHVIIVQLEIDAFYQKTVRSKKHELFGVVTETSLEVKNFEDVLDEDGELSVPRDFATKLLNIGIGNSRGLLKGLVSSNLHFSKCVLPLISMPVIDDNQLQEE